jgi:SecD/SecF fusion protein
VAGRTGNLLLLGLVAAGLCSVALLGTPGSPWQRHLRLGLDLQGGVEIVLRAVPPSGHTLTPDDVQRSIVIIRNRIDRLGVAEPDVRTQGLDEIAIELAGVHDPAAAARVIGKTAAFEVYDVERDLVAGPARSVRALRALRPPGGATAVLSCGPPAVACPGIASPPRRRVYYLFRHGLGAPEMTGKDLRFSGTTLAIDPDTRGPAVRLFFTAAGATKFHRLTAAAARRGRARGSPEHLALVLDGEIEELPSVDYRLYPHGIGGDGTEITNFGSLSQAAGLALVLQTGALPVTFRQVERTEVSATLGRESLRQARDAALWGLVAVAVLMLVVYRALGLVAVACLALYAAFLYGAILRLGVTLTLPGFAGVILTIGLAADANVVVFERIREEVRGGVPPRQALGAGYRRGLRTIVDANVVTATTAVVLFSVSAAGIRGFALMLLLGTVISFATALVATRALLGLLARSKRLDRLRLPGAGEEPGSAPLRIDFAGRWRLWLGISTVVIGVGAVSLGLRGLNLGIDFRGGGQLTFATARPVSTESVRTVARQAGRGDAVVQGLGSSSGGRYRRWQVRTGTLDARSQAALQSRLESRLGARAFGAQSVSASFSRQLVLHALWGLLVSLALIGLYLRWRFDGAFAAPVLVALVHDLAVTVGLYSLSGRVVTSATVAAVLTILGYSLYDTIIVFDRIRENAPRLLPRGVGFAAVANASLAETLRRSITTTVVTLLPVGALFLFGGATLKDFAFALLVGIASGAYSSIFIATPLLAAWKDRGRREPARAAADPSRSASSGEAA